MFGQFLTSVWPVWDTAPGPDRRGGRGGRWGQRAIGGNGLHRRRFQCAHTRPRARDRTNDDAIDDKESRSARQTDSTIAGAVTTIAKAQISSLPSVNRASPNRADRAGPDAVAGVPPQHPLRVEPGPRPVPRRRRRCAARLACVWPVFDQAFLTHVGQVLIRFRTLFEECLAAAAAAAPDSPAKPAAAAASARPHQQQRQRRQRQEQQR